MKYAVASVAHEMARLMYYMLKRGEPYRGVKVELWERKPGEDGEECVRRFAELVWMPLDALVFRRFSIGAAGR